MITEDIVSVGYIYALTNEAHPGLVKIGFTDRSPEIRAKELSSATGVPYPFEVAYYAETINPNKVEKQIHQLLSRKRVEKTEFFKTSIKDAKYAIDAFTKQIKPPHAPTPPKLTLEQKDEREIVVKKILQAKYQNRLKVIDRWLENLNLQLNKERNKRKGFIGFIKKCLSSNKQIKEYTTAIEKVETFKKNYTYEKFTDEHQEVKGINEIIAKKYASPTLEECVGIKVQEKKDTTSSNSNSGQQSVSKFSFELSNFKYFIPIDGFPFTLKRHLYFRDPIYCFDDFDKWIPSSNHNGITYDWSNTYEQDFIKCAFPSKLQPHYFTDDIYQEIWIAQWEQSELRKWWEKVDPKGYFPDNPFGENYSSLSSLENGISTVRYFYRIFGEKELVSLCI